MKQLTILFSAFLIVISCEIDQRDTEANHEIVKIYNHPDESINIEALSLLQIEDGFLILSENQSGKYPTAIIVYTNEMGEIIWSLETDISSPCASLMQIDGKIGFVGMITSGSFDGYFYEIDLDAGTITNSTPLGIKKPLAAQTIANNNFVILGFDNDNWNSTISLFNSSFSEENRSNSSTGDDYVSNIDNHIQRYGTVYPFFIGEYNDSTTNQSGFFVNYIYNSTLGVKFFDYAGNATGGQIFVHQVQFNTSSLLHKSGSEYAMTRDYGGTNYINTILNVDITSTQHFNDSTQNPWAELPDKARIQSQKIQFNDNEFMVFVSATNNNSVVITQYNMNETESYHDYYIDFSDEVEVVDILQDKTDDGLVILTTTHVTGQYERPMLIKVPKEHLKTK